MSEIKFYQVGGSVRDLFLGSKSKDIDYAVEGPSYEAMYAEVKARGGDPIDEACRPEYLTVKARWEGGVADFVLCRKDGSYYDGRHPDSVEPGTILDDLARRDFTMNAMARDEDGTLLDPYDGKRDIKGRIIRCVGDARARFSEDGLRMLRAIRFAVTKDMILDAQIVQCLSSQFFFEPRLSGVTIERIREELHRMFSFSTHHTLNKFDQYRYFRIYLFSREGLWLRPTLEVP